MNLDLATITVRVTLGSGSYAITLTDTLARWVEANRDLDDLEAKVAALVRGEVVCGGGGAAPVYKVERVTG